MVEPKFDFHPIPHYQPYSGNFFPSYYSMNIQAPVFTTVKEN